MKTHQQPLSVEDQIENLKAIGLTIEDETKAKELLNDISYYRIIKGYSIGLKDENGIYQKGVTFEQIEELYLFNAQFRYLLFPEIEKVEINLRCRIANFFSLKYGVLGYKDACHFNNATYHESFLKDLDAEIKRNARVPFVKHFLENYDGNELPFYAVVELLSFGTLSKFFKNMKNADKKEIANQFRLKYPYLESWIEHLSFVRNICAHYGRLYNIPLSKTPNLFSEYTNLHITNKRVYATLICLKHLLPNKDHWEKFVANIGLLLKNYPSVDKKKMGFPDNKNAWGNILLRPLDKLK